MTLTCMYTCVCVLSFILAVAVGLIGQWDAKDGRSQTISPFWVLKRASSNPPPLTPRPVNILHDPITFWTVNRRRNAEAP